jgi:hypothetical protein
MVELAPDAFLQGPWPAKAQQLQEASTLLQQQLQGADLSAMFSVRQQICIRAFERACCACFGSGCSV